MAPKRRADELPNGNVQELGEPRVGIEYSAFPIESGGAFVDRFQQHAIGMLGAGQGQDSATRGCADKLAL